MVDYKSLYYFLKKSRCSLKSFNLNAEERNFLKEFEQEATDYAKAPHGEDEIKEFYKKICDKKYKSAKELLEGARCLLNQVSDEICHHPHLRDNSLRLIKMITRLIKKRQDSKESGAHSLAENLHFQQSVRGDFTSFL